MQPTLGRTACFVSVCEKSCLRIFALAAAVFILLAGFPVIGLAQSGNASGIPSTGSGGSSTNTQLADFDRFLDAHPAIAADLKANPALVNDANYLRQHDELQAFLQDHPRIAQSLKQSPGTFWANEGNFEKHELGGAKDEAAERAMLQQRFQNEFLAKHSQIAADLRNDPNLVNDPEYLKKHPALSEFLQNHPNVRAELQGNPGSFINGTGQSGQAGTAKNSQPGSTRSSNAGRKTVRTKPAVPRAPHK